MAEVVDGPDGACLYQGETAVRSWPWYRRRFDMLAILQLSQKYQNEIRLSAMYRRLWAVVAMRLEKT